MVDLPPEEYKYDYGRKIIADYTPQLVLYDEQRRSEIYAWYEYCEGASETIDGTEIFDLPDGNSLETYREESLSYEYLTLFGSEILICGADTGKLPEEVCSPDIAVLQTTDHLGELSPDTRIIISDPACMLSDSRVISYADGGSEIDLDFHRNGTFTVHDR